MLLKFQGFATGDANITVVENGISCGECCVCVQTSEIKIYAHSAKEISCRVGNGTANKNVHLQVLQFVQLDWLH